MLKTLGSTKSLTRPGRGKVKVGIDNKAGRNGIELDESKVDYEKVGDSKIGNDEIEKKVQKLSKSKNLSKSKKMIGSDFFTFKTRLAFIKLRQTFFKTLILHHFDQERYILIEMDISSYVTGGVFSQLSLGD